MRIRTLGQIGCAMLALSACGRFGDSGGSGWNPMGWFGGGSNQPTTLAPEGGYPVASEGRIGIAQITGIRWEPLYEGRLLIVEGVPATKGWWGVELVTEVPMPRGRTRADETGTLRLRLVGNAPAPDSVAARSTPNPTSDTVTVALTLSNEALAGIQEVVVTGANNTVTLRK